MPDWRHDGSAGTPAGLSCCIPVSSMLGHYSAGFTLDTYAHVTTDAQFKAAQMMGNILSRAI